MERRPFVDWCRAWRPSREFCLRVRVPTPTPGAARAHVFLRQAYILDRAVRFDASNASGRVPHMEQHERTRDTKRTRFSLSQETIAIVTVGVALAGLILMETGEIRAEARADRARTDAATRAMRAEGQADRAEMRAEWRASREAFEKRIIQLVEQQGTLNGLVDGLRNPMDSAEE